MDPNHRLHLATRIHFGLLAQLGVAVSVEELLGATPEGREALWVCEAMDDPDLQALAQAFNGRGTAAGAAAAGAAAGGAATVPPRLRGEVPALHHAVAPRAPSRAAPPAAHTLPPPAAARALPAPAAASTAVSSAPARSAAPRPRPAAAFEPRPERGPARTPERPPAASAGHVPQPNAWSRDTSGFGFSRPQELTELERTYAYAPGDVPGDAPSDAPSDAPAPALNNHDHDRPHEPELAQEPRPAPFVPTADALRPSATPPDISWATALRNRPVPAERPGWKLAFWRKG